MFKLITALFLTFSISLWASGFDPDRFLMEVDKVEIGDCYMVTYEHLNISETYRIVGVKYYGKQYIVENIGERRAKQKYSTVHYNWFQPEKEAATKITCPKN